MRFNDLNDAVKAQFSQAIEAQEYTLAIAPFSDFELVKNLDIPKVLVTTGFQKLQQAKISALQLEKVFDEIHIDEIDDPERIFKKGIFERLHSRRDLAPHDYWVVGDNPESELKAGRELGFTTVQVAKLGQKKHALTDHCIAHYQELVALLEVGQ